MGVPAALFPLLSSTTAPVALSLEAADDEDDDDTSGDRDAVTTTRPGRAAAAGDAGDDDDDGDAKPPCPMAVLLGRLPDVDPAVTTIKYGGVRQKTLGWAPMLRRNWALSLGKSTVGNGAQIRGNWKHRGQWKGVVQP